MKFSTCKRLLNKLTASFSTQSEDAVPAEQAELIGKQTFDKSTGDYGLIHDVKIKNGHVQYILDWTTYNGFGGMPRLRREELDDIEHIVILDR